MHYFGFFIYFPALPAIEILTEFFKMWFLHSILFVYFLPKLVPCIYFVLSLVTELGQAKLKQFCMDK